LQAVAVAVRMKARQAVAVAAQTARQVVTVIMWVVVAVRKPAAGHPYRRGVPLYKAEVPAVKAIPAVPAAAAAVILVVAQVLIPTQGPQAVAVPDTLIRG
jgi:hypothetical protein